MTVTIQLIRHGKTKGNLEKRFAGGRTDDSLCTQGKEELNSFVSENIYLNTDEVFSSPMNRCLETAEIIFPEHKARIIEEFRELDFGIFENKNHQELNGNQDYQKWLDSGGKGNIPGGEKMDDFANRTMAGFNKMISSIEGKETKITAAVHGGTIMAILFSLNGGNFYDYFCKNGRGYVFEFLTEDKKILNLRKL
ncbi:MAG: histidine phosphatase family protein [Treponema sp.]|uniref:histidine phosphatase family protein n=1 Tax=Treponema sp. TaxID=166 RepID=UPI001D55F158|nr:histidine phosphatase family protein [Treponema sp.]MBS7241219.1 histidine phosphatase family protein [Treponema sp.]